MPRAACILALLPAQLSTASAATFTVHDVRSAREISETTQLFIDNRLAATFHLDSGTSQAAARVQVPDDATNRYRYDLCGTITIRSDEGMPEVHEVNDTGLLNDPDHRIYEALGTEDFTLFYLADPDDPEAATSLRLHSGLCRGPIS